MPRTNTFHPQSSPLKVRFSIPNPKQLHLQNVLEKRIFTFTSLLVFRRITLLQRFQPGQDTPLYFRMWSFQYLQKWVVGRKVFCSYLKLTEHIFSRSCRKWVDGGTVFFRNVFFTITIICVNYTNIKLKVTNKIMCFATNRRSDDSIVTFQH